MKKAMFLAAALGLLSLPVLAQSGSSAGGPARQGPPGAIGGGVPGTQPNMVERRIGPKRARAIANKNRRNRLSR